MKHLEREWLPGEWKTEANLEELRLMAGVLKAVEAYTGEGFTTVSISNFNVM